MLVSPKRCPCAGGAPPDGRRCAGYGGSGWGVCRTRRRTFDEDDDHGCDKGDSHARRGAKRGSGCPDPPIHAP